MADKAQFDLVIYGASGFTGRLVAEYVHQQYGDSNSPDALKWAMAGRNLDKLTEVRAEMGISENVALLKADADDEQSMRDMLAQTRTVLTTVGPYQLYGSELVALCAETGTDYVDLCGEPAWMRKMIDAHQKTAQKSGARIVFSCGFDSIPFDLGVYFLQSHAKQTLGHTFSRVKGRVRAMKGTFSGGTAASLKATMAAAKQDPEVMKLLLNPFSLTPGFQGAAQPPGNKPIYEEEFNSWSAPFIMAAINTRNIHRSNFLMEHEYGENFVYDEMLFTGPGEKGEQTANAVASDKSLASDDGPKPGEGPDKAAREAGHYDVLFVGEDDKGQSLAVSVSGDLDPGYGSTSKMIAESAVCLCQDADDLPGGIWTPAPAMGDALIARLSDNAGLTFKVE